MNRSFLGYVVVVVVPCIAATLFAGLSARQAWDDLRFTSQAQVGWMVLASLERDLGEADGVLAAEPPREPTAAIQVGRLTGYDASLYLRGGRWTGVEGQPGPEQLDPALLSELSRSPGGLRVPDSDAVLRARSTQPGVPPSLVALVSPREAPAPPVAPRIVAVTALLMLFALLAGWIQLARPAGKGVRRPSPVTVALVSVVPALTAVFFMEHLTRTFEMAATEATAGDLTRGLAVATARGIATLPDDVRLLTGFHATLVSSGGVVRSTYASEPMEIPGLPAPPASFTGSGRVGTPEGPSAYAALRGAADSITVVTAPLPATRTDRFRRKLLQMCGGLLAWLLLAGAWSLRAVRAAPA